MINEILNIYQNSVQNLPKPVTVTCKYCNKVFTKESTLTAHACEPKRRYQQQNETGVQFGFRSYLRFFELTQGSTKLKTYDDFVASPYYNAFVRFGRYLVTVKVLDLVNFTEWLLKNNKKLDQWCKDSFYEEWLIEYMRKENYQDALERGIKEMELYSESHPELENGFVDYFRFGNSNKICHHIVTGRISPWVIYNCNSGISFLESLPEDRLLTIIKYIDPDFWNINFKKYSSEQRISRDILNTAGL